MSFNLTIKSDDAIKYPNPFVPDPLLLYYYTFNGSDITSGNLLKNLADNEYDLQINSGVVNGIFSGSSMTATISSSLTLTADGYSVGCWFNLSAINVNGHLFSFSNDITNNTTLFFAIFSNGFSVRDAINSSNLSVMFGSVILALANGDTSVGYPVIKVG